MQSFGTILEQMVRTDFPNLFFNTITAPVLIWVTWRKEPAAEVRSKWAYKVGEGGYHVVDDKLGRPLLYEKEDENLEREELLEELANAIVALPSKKLAED